ncbi:carbon-nitrogen hydrolase family protein [Cryobacterium sp. PH31-O1]|uniref:carbon-nitrogen hydrolase family protein n=1 Tax=Cryobacterium sp. PH31-O1 TaxID=3046306 RepID=UPI0024B98FD7|nr:carbon-nitrogen hydrolase family protein [Cryobacterium sp. PH31-O1]MDJ0337315.1 carbon-nitrogen hydrolase family protein [Cryobacterium sp. PH31-O1]
MKITVCQLDNRSTAREEVWSLLAAHVESARPDLLVLPEMPFSDWLANDRPTPDAADRWAAAVAEQHRVLTEIEGWNAGAVLGTRPILRDGTSRRNEVFVATDGQPARGIREKYYLPDEAGYWEASWYDRGALEFPQTRVAGASIGVQVCTELWFFEWARRLGREGADIVAVPRATPRTSTSKWLAGGRSAAVTSGAFCVSSNLGSPLDDAEGFGGCGWIIDPEGNVLATTSEDDPFATVEIDLADARAAKSTYPRYVAE